MTDLRWWSRSGAAHSEAAAAAAAGASPASPPVATLGGVESPVMVADDDEPPSPPGFNTAASPPAPPRPDYRRPLAEMQGGKDFVYPDEDMDDEDQMMNRAIAESMEGMRPGIGRASAGAPGAPITIDDEDEDVQRAIRESMLGAGGSSGFDAAAAIGLGGAGPARRSIRRSRSGAAEHERDNRPPPARAADLIFGPLRSEEELGRRRPAMFGGSAPQGTQDGVVGGGGGAGGMRAGNGGQHDFVELPDGIDREEARMLEAAMLGIPYEAPAHRTGSGLGINGVGITPSVESTEAGMLRSEQDWAYEESLRADRAKDAAKREAEKAAAAEAAAAAAVAAAEAEKVAVAAAQRDKAIAAAANALPDEPEAGAEDVIDVAIRLPDGRRVRRRFAKSHPLQAIFSFLVSAEHLEAGTYRLVSQFPRRSFENMAEGAPTLEQAGLNQKQEALFVEMTTG